MKYNRRTQILKNNKWIDIEFKNLKSGDKFRIFESDGSIVKDKNDNIEFVAISEPYLYPTKEEEVWQIDTL